MPTELRELIEQSGLTVSDGCIHGVKVCGLDSANGRTYPGKTLDKAKAMYEGARVNVNHPKKGEEKQPRSYKDRIGKIEGVHFVEGKGLFAKLRYNPKHPNTEQLLWDAEHDPSAVGLSHVANGRTSGPIGKQVVEEIISVSSVDLVTDPATTRGLYESTEAKETDMEFSSLTVDLIKANRPDLVESIVKPFRDQETAQLKELTEAKAELTTLKDAAAVQAKRAKIDQLLTEAALPDSHKTKPFVDSLYLLEETQAKALIEDRKAISGVRKPESRGGAGSTTQSQSVDDFARSLR